MSRYIDADALIDRLDFCVKEGMGSKIAYTFKHMVGEAPSIDIVRCKECKYYGKFPTWSVCTYWSGDPYEQASVNEDDFCSYGERESE